MLSVVICTHNPRQEYLSRVLEGLRAQTLATTQWELVVIDNASSPAVEPDLSWHPSARTVIEAELGLTHARLRGIAETSGEVMVFVDDDNVLDPDYLSVAAEIADDWPRLGAWGGQSVGEFETQPVGLAARYEDSLAIRTFEEDRWSNLPLCSQTVPWGAGMCVRRAVAEKYSTEIATDLLRQSLGVKGSGLLRGEDLDLAFTAADVGLGTGLFTALRLTHLIPAVRLSDDYMLRLLEGDECSQQILRFVRGQPYSNRAPWKQFVWRCYIMVRVRDGRIRKAVRAKERGRRRASALIANSPRG